MNLPGGKPLKTGLDVASTDFLKLLDELKLKKFSGYLCLTVKVEGMEEGVLLFDAGKIVGSSYEYLRHGVKLSGEKAFVRVLNATAAKHGVMDLFMLNAEQVHLALAFNEDVVFVPNEASLRKVRIEKFSPFYEQEIAGKEVGPVKKEDDPARKYKMGALTAAVDAPKENVLAEMEENP